MTNLPPLWLIPLVVIVYPVGAIIAHMHHEDEQRKHKAALALFWPIVVLCSIPRALFHAALFGLRGHE